MKNTLLNIIDTTGEENILNTNTMTDIDKKSLEIREVYYKHFLKLIEMHQRDGKSINDLENFIKSVLEIKQDA